MNTSDFAGTVRDTRMEVGAYVAPTRPSAGRDFQVVQKITAGQISVFALLFTLIALLGPSSAWLLLGRAPLGDFRGLALTGATVVFAYAWAFAVYRLFLRWMPLEEGLIMPGSRAAFAAQVNTLFYLMLFFPLIRTHVLPVPVLRMVYKALGAKMGTNSYSSGCLLDPPLTEMGAHCMVGHGAVLFAHAMEGGRFSLSRIRIGNSVTVGAQAIVMAGVEIGDGAIVSAGAVVPKNTRIGPGEVWAGIPARRIR